MIEGFTIFMGIACLISLFIIAFLITAFVLVCIRSVDPTSSPRDLEGGIFGFGSSKYNHMCEECDLDFDEVLAVVPPPEEDEVCHHDQCQFHKLSHTLLEHIYPTSKTAIIGKDVGEFELMTSANV